MQYNAVQHGQGTHPGLSGAPRPWPEPRGRRARQSALAEWARPVWVGVQVVKKHEWACVQAKSADRPLLQLEGRPRAHSSKGQRQAFAAAGAGAGAAPPPGGRSLLPAAPSGPEPLRPPGELPAGRKRRERTGTGSSEGRGRVKVSFQTHCTPRTARMQLHLAQSVPGCLAACCPTACPVGHATQAGGSCSQLMQAALVRQAGSSPLPCAPARRCWECPAP